MSVIVEKTVEVVVHVLKAVITNYNKDLTRIAIPLIEYSEDGRSIKSEVFKLGEVVWEISLWEGRVERLGATRTRKWVLQHT